MWRRNPRFKSDQIWFIWSYVSIWTKFNLRWHFIRCKILSTNFRWQKTFQTPIKRWKSHHRETLRPPWWSLQGVEIRVLWIFYCGFSFCILSPHISGGKQKGSNKSETLKLWRREISSKMPEQRFSRWKTKVLDSNINSGTIKFIKIIVGP